MQLERNIKVSKEDLMYFIIHVNNLSGKFTKNELRLLAKIMMIYPKQLSSDTRPIIMDELNINKAYMSQLTSSLVNKQMLTRQGHNSELASPMLRSMVKDIHESDKATLLYNVTYD